MLPEKRISNRFEFAEIVQLHDVHYSHPEGYRPNGGSPLNLQGINIGKDGICLRTDYFFIPNHLFQLDFKLRNKDIHTVARVVWSEKSSCGLEFLKSKDVEDALETLTFILNPNDVIPPESLK